MFSLYHFFGPCFNIPNSFNFDITTLGQKAVAFPNMQGFNPGPAIIPNLLMKGASAAISPQIPMPNISINVPKIEAPAAKLGKIVIEKQMIPIPSVKFPMPNINFHQVAIPKMPHFKACLYDCPDLVVPIPELHKSVVNLVEKKVVEQPVVPKKMILSYVCLLYTSPSPRDQRGSRMPSSA